MITFKEPRLEREFISDDVSRDLRIVIVALAAWFEGRTGRDIVITSVLPESGVERVSVSHKQGRAADVRTKDWPEGLAEGAASWVNARFSTGVYKSDGIPMYVAVYHDSGYGEHIHMQVAKGRPVQIISPSGTILV